MSIAVPIGVSESKEENKPSAYDPSSEGPIVPVSATLPPPKSCNRPNLVKSIEVTDPTEVDPDTVDIDPPPAPGADIVI